MELILPSLYSELEGPALPNIVKKIKEVDYLNHIVIGLDQADEDQYRAALEFFDELGTPFNILWNDGPRLKELDEELREHDLAPRERGKGRNVWYCMGMVLARSKAEAVALHDCDILTYDRGLLAKLFYPVANPNFQFEFCKGYYPRVADGKINGRVSRLLVGPLLIALENVLGPRDYLNFMKSFRYPLAGEFATRRELLKELRVPSDWGLEIGVLSEMYRNQASNRICQVDIAPAYDHKHQDLSADNDQSGLSKMSIDITKTLIRKLANQGNIFTSELFRTLKATYYRTALDFVEMYHKAAVLNGLKLDVHYEEQAVETFAENVVKAGEVFLQNPDETPFIPTWARVISAIPDFHIRLRLAVEKDNKEYKK